MTGALRITLLGHGRLGSALAEGWGLTGAATPTILTRANQPVCPAGTEALVIAVKPAQWREAVTPLATSVPPGAVVISVMAGVRSADIASVLSRPIARVMPTTAVAKAQGVAAIWADDVEARGVAHALFDPVADAVDLDQEALLDPATAVAGSAPAFFHAFAQALASAGFEAGLPPEAAERLARGALRSAGAGAATDASFEDLIARIASPCGTTRAGLDALMEARLSHAAKAAVEAAVARARTLAGDQTS
ncbi:pyrroline-5-carboxylate reductase family protein [Brevundimonas bacteroides]|uniref:pyrroline-5-carboxylate reductase family protein n=1 Tax=Brevundimonas bacteroides TaxID=74311 RepID=UPI000495D4A2|nr:pyrroline-5-carboxylate reductase dimerization domain-containing protein [Brevundimonas bacteroides]